MSLVEEQNVDLLILDLPANVSRCSYRRDAWWSTSHRGRGDLGDCVHRPGRARACLHTESRRMRSHLQRTVSGQADELLDTSFLWKRGARRLRRRNHLLYAPPCGTIAGFYAQTDLPRGVLRAPAGVETSQWSLIHPPGNGSTYRGGDARSISEIPCIAGRIGWCSSRTVSLCRSTAVLQSLRL